MPSRRFPRPGAPTRSPAATSSANGQALTYICSRDSEAEALQAKVLTKDEPRRIAVIIAWLPKLLGKDHRN